MSPIVAWDRVTEDKEEDNCVLRVCSLSSAWDESCLA